MKTGLRETIAAYLSAFTILDDVILIVATNDSKALEAEIQNIKKALGLFNNDKHFAHIAIISSGDVSVMNYLHEQGDFFIDVSYNARTNQNLMTAIVNNSFPIMLDTCANLLNPYPFVIQSQEETSLYLQRPLALLYTGHHTWRIPLIRSLKEKMLLAHQKQAQNNLRAEHAVLLAFKSQMLSLQNQWIQECIQ
jgi:hypothetical protein